MMRRVVLLILIVLYCLPSICAASGLTPDQRQCVQGGDCKYYQDQNCVADTTASSPASSGGVSIDGQAATKAAQSAPNGAKVGYALYDSSGKLLANYSDTSENYGASITKSMLLVAYLRQEGSGALSSQAKTELTNMIENSDNTSADWIYNQLSNGGATVNQVASSAGMTNFHLDNTSDSIYVLGQSKITANDFAKFFSKIDTLFPAAHKDFALGLLSHLSSADQNGLLNAGLPGTVYSKEGWKPESSGLEGAPYIVNQAAQFSAGGTTYGVAVTVGGTTDQSSGEAIVQSVVSALINPGASDSGPSGCCSGSGSTTLSGNSNEEKIFNYFVGKGLTEIQAAGIDGNFGQESGWNPSDSGGYLAQWSSTRLAGLSALANKEGKSETDLGIQLDYVWQELNGGYSTVLQHLKAATTVEDAVNQFMGPDNLSGQPVSVTDPSQRGGGYEDPGIPAGQNRLDYANHALTKYGHGGGAGGGSSCGSGSPDCTTATGDAKILCEAKKYEGIYYEFGGGHQGLKAFLAGCPDPSNPPNNQPTGGPVNGDPAGKSGSPSPCATDCSGLVSLAVDEAFNQNYMWTVAADSSMQGSGANYWKSIPFSQASAGDIVTLSGHVEIVDHVSGNTVYTFGSHETGTKTGPTSAPESYWTGGTWHWTGPGSS